MSGGRGPDLRARYTEIPMEFYYNITILDKCVLCDAEWIFN